MAFFTGFLALGNGSGSTFTEISGGVYARAPVTFSPIVSGYTTTTSQPVFAGANYNTFSNATQFGLFDASTGGNNLLIFNNPGFSAAGALVVAVQGLSMMFPDLLSATGTASLIFAPTLQVATVTIQQTAPATQVSATVQGFAGTSIYITSGLLGKF